MLVQAEGKAEEKPEEEAVQEESAEEAGEMAEGERPKPAPYEGFGKETT